MNTYIAPQTLQRYFSPRRPPPGAPPAMFPMGSDYRPTPSELNAPPSTPEEVRLLGEGVQAAWSEMEDTLGSLLSGAPRDAALPCVLAAAALHALYVRLSLVGHTTDQAHAPVEDTPLGLLAYLTVQILALAAVFFSLSALEALLRWRGGKGRRLSLVRRPVFPLLRAVRSRRPRRPAQALHAAAPLVYGLAAFLPLAFYATVWSDPHFQASAITPRAALGQPIRAWMHETHSGPLLCSCVDLLGTARPPELLASRGRLVAVAAAYGVFYSALMEWVASHAGGLYPYSFMTRLGTGGRMLFCASSCCVLAAFTLAARGVLAAWSRKMLALTAKAKKTD